MMANTTNEQSTKTQVAAPQTADEVRVLAMQEKERREAERRSLSTQETAVRRVSEGNA